MSMVLQDVSDGVLHIQLNRPEKRNALDYEMLDALADAAEAARENAQLGAVVLSGVGKSFCAGLDFAVHRSFAAKAAAGQRPYADPDDPTTTGRTPGVGQRIVKAFRDTRVPVIAAVHGHAIGAGLQITLGADIRIVTSDVQLSCAEIEFGLTVDVGGSQLLPRLIGPDRAMDLLVSGRRISGEDAARWGLATRVRTDPLEEAIELARAISQRNSYAIVQTKRLLRLAETATVDDGMRVELSVLAKNIGSPLQVEAAQRYFATRNR
jgi:enoyl-CoA hydratase/carnithine racemase